MFRNRSSAVRLKECCEICGLYNPVILHKHHVIPRQDPRSTNDNFNLAILCPNCHNLVHTGELVIIGIYQTSIGVKPVWFKSGEEPPLPKELWKVKDNPFIITLGEKKDDILPKEGE